MLTKKGEIFMKLLAIENNKGTYSIDGINFIEIEKISKDDILNLLERVLSEAEIIIEESNEDNKKINSPAQKIIYDNIYEKVNEVLLTKEEINSFEEDQYYIAMQKYQNKE